MENIQILSRKEGNVLFNDALSTFIYGYMGLHRLLFPINSKGSFICTFPDRITHTTAFVTPVVEHWLEREIAKYYHEIFQKLKKVKIIIII